jgi:hypothetical protein
MGKKHLQLAIVKAIHRQSSTDTGHRQASGVFRILPGIEFDRLPNRK